MEGVTGIGGFFFREGPSRTPDISGDASKVRMINFRVRNLDAMVT